MNQILCRPPAPLAATVLMLAGWLAGRVVPASGAEPPKFEARHPEVGARGTVQSTQGAGPMSVVEQPFGQTAEGSKESLLTLTNAKGNQVKLTTYGAGSWR